MADLKFRQLEKQLKKIGSNYQFWGRAEIKELAHVLLPDEVVEHCVNGSYEGGFALLVATDQRVLLIDKKPFYLTLEDVRFDMIAEVDFNHRLLNATLFICTPNKALRFTAFNHVKARKFFHFVQTRVMDIRQHYSQQNQPQQAPAVAFTPSDWIAYAMQLQQQVQQASQQFASNQAAHSQPAIIEAAPSQPATTQTFHRRVPPIISAYTRLPMMSRQRRFLGSRAMGTPMSAANSLNMQQQ